MATASKAFRARAFDANKPMGLYWAQELPDLSECATGNRAVTQMPSGMEKEEEMESHLQDAILAQQASTSGIQVENHVIPTPKVFPVESERYDRTYPSRNRLGRTKYIKVHAWQALERDEPEYDYDTEDEEWLSVHPHVEPKVLERIFDTVEANSSETQIASEDSVINIHKSLDPSIVYEVYEYWLSKRTSAATTSGCIGVGGLIPRVRTECRKDTQGSVNPYVAFRRRAEKMQTRKNRKNDEDNYEKTLKLVHDFTKASTLFDMVTRREKTKLAVIELESEMLTKRMELSDFGSTSVYAEFMERLRSTTFNSTSSSSQKQLSEGGQMNNGIVQQSDQDVSSSKKKKKSKKSRVAAAADAAKFGPELVSKSWLKQNAELWHKPPTIFGQSHVGGSGVQPIADVDKPARESYVDGRYTFKRRRGCVYRAAHTASSSNLPVQQQQRSLAQVDNCKKFYETCLPTSGGTVRSIGFARRRVGRGGRVIFDRLVRSSTNPSPSTASAPNTDDFVEDCSRKFRARLLPSFCDDSKSNEESDDERSSSDRFFAASDRYRFNDSDNEREWSSSRGNSIWKNATNSKHEVRRDGFHHQDGETKCEELSDVERMEVDNIEKVERVSSQSDERKRNGHVERSSRENMDEEADEILDDEGIFLQRHSIRDERTKSTTKAPRPSSQSGNGLADRVAEPTPVPAKMCGTVSDSDEWREPSGSPSESNSSTEWVGFVPATTREKFVATSPATYNSKMIGVVVDDEEEVDEEEDCNDSCTGNRPTVRKPSNIKDVISAANVTTLLEHSNKYIIPPSIGSS